MTACTMESLFSGKKDTEQKKHRLSKSCKTDRIRRQNNTSKAPFLSEEPVHLTEMIFLMQGRFFRW